MEITLRHLEIRNFKGVKSLSVPFGEDTAICGANATGKTTVFDAFVWLLFGKDSNNSTMFNIKTLGKDGNAIPKIEHEVEGILEVNGMPIKFRRTYKEKWVTRRASAEEIMDGHETKYAIDDIEVLAGEYQRRVSQILNEDVFRMVTDPLYFNSKKWEERRKVLIDMAGDLNDADILTSKPEFRTLIEKMGNKSIDELKAMIKTQKRPIQKRLDEIPARVDEVDRNMPEAEDWELLTAESDRIKADISGIDASIINRSKPAEEFYRVQSERQERIHMIDRHIQQIIYGAKLRQQEGNNDLNAKRRKMDSEIDAAQRDINSLSGRVAEYDRTISQAEIRRKEYLDVWHALDSEQFTMSDGSCICPTCLREFDTDAIAEKEAELRKNFTDDKTKRLNETQTNGRRQKQIIEDTEQTKIDTENRLEALREKLARLRKEYLEFPEPATEPPVTAAEVTEIAALRKEREVLKSDNATAPVIDVDDLQEQKQKLQDELNNISWHYSKKERIEELEKRKAELLSEQKTQAQAKAELQKLELLLLDFSKTKMAIVDERVNGRFKYVKFRLFSKQVNGEEVECCDALVNGVPYEDANNAAKINAGIDIINALCEFYGVTAPIFIDNRESVNTLVYTQSQVISLIVTTDKELLII